MAQAKDNEALHPQSIKLPAAIEIFANLKNAQKFAIDIGNGPFCHSNFSYNFVVQ